jgi:hypothetical protein
MGTRRRRAPSDRNLENLRHIFVYLPAARWRDARGSRRKFEAVQSLHGRSHVFLLLVHRLGWPRRSAISLLDRADSAPIGLRLLRLGRPA